MKDRHANVYKIKHSQLGQKPSLAENLSVNDICFYQFVGGNAEDNERLLERIHTIRERCGLLIAVFRFPYRFEGKQRARTAIRQYYLMKKWCDGMIYYLGDGMMEKIEPGTPMKEAHEKFVAFEESCIHSMMELVDTPGEMNIDVSDIQSFVKRSDGPLFLHTIEGDVFNEPLKHIISEPYLPFDFTEGKELILNIGYTKDIDMNSYQQINLRIHDLFHKADLVKLGTYYMDEPGTKLKITLFVNHLNDPFPPEESLHTLSLKMLREKWKSLFYKRKQGEGVYQKEHVTPIPHEENDPETVSEEKEQSLFYKKGL